MISTFQRLGVGSLPKPPLRFWKNAGLSKGEARYDFFKNDFAECMWKGVVIEGELKKIVETYVKYPPRKLQSLGHAGHVVSLLAKHRRTN